MKLVSCYVENFGAINRREYKFNKGLTVLSGENGSGKTTLAEFLKAMFYGLPSVRAGSDRFNARQRYYPFSGGKFGGNVVFEANGKIWRIVRFFDKKSDSRDETLVYCGGKTENIPASGIGKYFFGLNESSFEKTAFFNSELSGGAFDADAIEKLGGAARATGGANADEALAVLEKNRRVIKAARGSGGLADRKKAELRQYADEAARLKEIRENLTAKYAERAAAEERIKLAENGEKRALTPEYAANKSKSRLFIALLIVAVAFAAGGIALCFHSLLAGAALVAAGLVVFVCAFATRRKKTLKTQDTAGATEDIGALYRALAQVDAAIGADESEIERLPDILSAKERAEEELARLTSRYETYSAAIYYLSEAKKRLSDKYAVPVRSSFYNYLSKFNIACGAKITLTDELEIILDGGGELHGERHLSTGQRCACGLCLRLALIDNMYAAEKPFLVFDDPFTGLDEKNLAVAAKVLSETARDIQIIYFTCHNLPY